MQSLLATAICPAAGCFTVSHLICLSRQFTAQNGGDAAPMVPRGGNCSGCGGYILWGDVIRSCYRRHCVQVGAPVMPADSDVGEDMHQASSDGLNRQRTGKRTKRSRSPVDSGSGSRVVFDLDDAVSSGSQAEGSTKLAKRRRLDSHPRITLKSKPKRQASKKTKSAALLGRASGDNSHSDADMSAGPLRPSRIILNNPGVTKQRGQLKPTYSYTHALFPNITRLSSSHSDSDAIVGRVSGSYRTRSLDDSEYRLDPLGDDRLQNERQVAGFETDIFDIQGDALERSISVLSISSRPCSPMVLEISSD